MYHKRRYLDVLESISPLLFCEVLLSAYLHVCVSGLWRTWINHMSKLHQISGVCFLVAVVRHSFDDKCSKLCRLLPVLLTASTPSCSHKHRRRQWGVQVCSQWLTKERHWKRSLMSTITLFIASFRVIQVYVVAEKNVLSTGLLVLSAYDVRPSVSFRRSVPAWARSRKPVATQVCCCVPGW